MQEQVSGALCALGESQPEEALRACEQYMRQQEKVSPEGGTCCGWGGGRAGAASLQQTQASWRRGAPREMTSIVLWPVSCSLFGGRGARGSALQQPGLSNGGPMVMSPFTPWLETGWLSLPALCCQLPRAEKAASHQPQEE